MREGFREDDVDICTERIGQFVVWMGPTSAWVFGGKIGLLWGGGVESWIRWVIAAIQLVEQHDWF